MSLKKWRTSSPFRGLGGLTDADGNIAQHVEYIPYGEVFVEERNSQFSTNFLFNAKELDNETGLYYYGARYLDPTGAMWLSVDPMWEKYIDANPYNYCHGNPVTMIDPDGRNDEYYSCDGKYLGYKESETNDVYAVKGETKKAIKHSVKTHGQYYGTLKDGEYALIPQGEDRDMVISSANKSLKSKRENGGHITFDSQRIEWEEGPEAQWEGYDNNGNAISRASIVPFKYKKDGDTKAKIHDEEASKAKFIYHIHPKTCVKNPDNPDVKVWGGRSKPSPKDLIYAAKTPKAWVFVIGLQDKNVQYYNKDGSFMTIKFKAFEKMVNIHNVKK